MHEAMPIIIGIFQIALLNIMLSCDSISVIALITSKLPSRFAKKAYLTGITAGVILTIFFASIMSFIMEIQWLPIQLIGGVLLIKIAVDLLKAHGCKQESEADGKQGKRDIKFWSAVFNIIIVGIALSMDNVLAIAGAADGDITAITFGLIISLPFILFASHRIVKLIQKNILALYISGAILVYTASEMILSYRIISPFVPRILAVLIPIMASFATVLYGVCVIKKHQKTHRTTHVDKNKILSYENRWD